MKLRIHLRLTQGGDRLFGHLGFKFVIGDCPCEALEAIEPSPLYRALRFLTLTTTPPRGQRARIGGSSFGVPAFSALAQNGGASPSPS